MSNLRFDEDGGYHYNHLGSFLGLIENLPLITYQSTSPNSTPQPILPVIQKEFHLLLLVVVLFLF